MAIPTRSYVIDSNGKCICYKSDTHNQIVVKLQEAVKLTTFHDSDLAQCTKEINALLERVEKSNRDPRRVLAFLNTPNGLFLAWTESGIGPSDDEEELTKALGISS